MSKYSNFREWQCVDVGDHIFQLARKEVDKIVIRDRPRIIVQLEGRPFLDTYPNDVWYYHVSEDAENSASGYTVEAEQGYMPFPDQSVGLLLLGHAVELYDDQTRLFSEIERVLANDGKAFMVTLVYHWLGACVPKRFHPLERLDVHPQSIKVMRMRAKQMGLSIHHEEHLLPDKEMGLTVTKLKEKILYPLGIELKKNRYQWQGVSEGMVNL